MSNVKCEKTNENSIIAHFTFLIPHFIFLVFLTACSDFFEPVDSTPAPTEYTYNYWLLQRTYLFEDELASLDENGDSVSDLYTRLQDPYTRYVPPSKSEAAITQTNTSIIPGDVGMEYILFSQADHPLIIYRVYPESPAGRAGINRYGNILNVNGIELIGENAKDIYDSILLYNKDLSITVAYQGDTTTYEITKEDVYAPTVFIDTLDNVEIITIKAFKLNTVDKQNGTLGELRTYLEATTNSTAPRLIDLRNNPGGHVNHCTAMADLFIPEGPISIRSWRTFDTDGTPIYRKEIINAKKGDAGENKKFVVLVNKNSASCSEIFTAALQEGANIPIAGETTYGKGIGQTTWHTMAGGLAYITNIEFLTPKQNSYHKKGIIPKYTCDSPSIICGLEAIQKHYGKTLTQKSIPDYLDNIIKRSPKDFEGGAIIESDFVPDFTKMN